uniref:C1q domain-containing protein n=1 Tax=viral metagenome TaxID=1070528 RepID=A0A6H1ZN01_9ZZZZ
MAFDNNVPLAANQIAADLAAINANWEALVPLSGNLGTPSAGDLRNCFPSNYFPDYNEADQGATGNGKSAKAYIDAISTNSATLVFRHNSGAATTTYTFSTAETIPSNITVVVEKGAILAIPTGIIVSLNGKLSAGLTQVFSCIGTGKAEFSSGSVGSVHPIWWGLHGDDTTNDSVILQAAYDAAYTAVAPLILPGKTMKITTGLIFDKRVNVYGADHELTTIKKYGAIIGVKIGHAATGAGGEQRYENFNVLGASGANTLAGIEVWAGNYIVMKHIWATLHGSHGLHIRGGNIGTYIDINANSNLGDGIRIEGNTGLATVSANANTFIKPRALANGGQGFHIAQATAGYSSANNVYGLVSEQNGDWNLLVSDKQNNIEAYTEAGVNGDVALTATSERNIVKITAANALYTDAGSDNVILDISQATGSTFKIDALTQTNASENKSKLLQTEDIFSDFVVTGLLPATSVNLISNISAGHAYVTGTRVNKAATSKTYTASKDTYVDVNSAGTYTLVEVALGAAAPAVTADSIRLAKVVTDADNITGVTDLRELKISVAPAFATPDLGTPSAVVLTNATGLPVATGLAAGIFTNTGQPAFLAQADGAQTNIAHTTETTLLFPTEIFDVGANFASSIFTAPVTGKYQISFQINIAQIDFAATYTRIILSASNRTYYSYLYPIHFTADGSVSVGMSMLLDMDANDTVRVSFYQLAGTAQANLLDISHFSGVLIC